ncbi:MAG TPA: sialidase family protein [Thermoanaerobaculia bacterium]|jgi:hypothetical protein
MNLRLAVAFVALLPAALYAATTPASGTISPASPTVSFSGGPFAASNPSDPLGETPPVCTDQICGQYALTVSIPASDFNTYSAHLSVSWVNSGTTTQGSDTSDFDAYVYSPDVTGTEVGTAASSSNPETTAFDVGSGTYTIYVVPYDVSPSVTFNATVTLVRKTAGGSTPWPPNLGNTSVPPGTPRFFNYAAPSGWGEYAGEPGVGVNRKTEKVFGGIPNGGTVNYYGGFLPYMLSVTFDDRTAPAAATWKQVPLTMAALPRVYGDPYLFTDRDTGRTFVTQELALTPLGSTMEFTDNDNAPFTPSTGSGAPSGVDHETIGGGPYHAPIPTGVNPLYPNGVWYCSQSIADAVCSISLDGGITFGPAVPLYTAADCAGIHGHIKIGRDGTAYVPNRGCGGDAPFHSDPAARQALVVSENNGLTWTVHQVPFATSKGNRDPSVAVADDGTVYFAWQALDGHSHVAVSHDKGVTWAHDTDLGAALGIQNSLFHAAVAGDGNRAAVAFFGTTTGGDNYNAADFTGTWYLFISTTLDGGVTWVTQNATPGDPIQRGGICDSGTCRNLLDFFDATIDKEGRVVVGYDDGCVGPGCISGSRSYGMIGSNDFTAKAVIARQASGKRMYAQFDSMAGADITPPIPPQSPAPATSCGDGVVATDSTGDADHPLVHSVGGTPDQVDFTALSFSLTPDKTALTTTIAVKNFTAQPINGSSGTYYYTTWISARNNPDGTLATRAYATRASVSATGVTYSFGQYDQTNDAFIGTATTVTGSYTTGPNGTISVTVPLSLLGNPAIPVTDANALPAVIEPYAVAIILEGALRFVQAADRIPNAGYYGASWSVCLPPPVVCIDDSDTSIAYSDNWHQLTVAGASGGHLRMHAGNSPRDSVALTINVSGGPGKVTVNYATSPKGGSAEVFIDGVSKGVISFAGTTGSTKSPTPGASASYGGLSSGSHTFELRNLSGNVYLDGFCLEYATSTGTPTGGPGATSTSSSVEAPPGTYSVSVVAEAAGNLPIKLALIDPNGLTLAVSDNSSGLAVLDVPVSAGGIYRVQVINLSLGPVEVWTAATPNVKR